MFRATSVAQGFQMIGTMFAGFRFTDSATVLLHQLLNGETVAIVAVSVAACLPWKVWLGGKKWLEPVGYCLALVLLVLCLAKLATGGFTPFIYAQF